MQDLQTIDVGKHDVQDEHIGFDIVELADRFPTVVRDLDGPALVVQRHLDQVGQGRFVVYQQHPDRGTAVPADPGELAENGLTWPLITRGSRHNRHGHRFFLPHTWLSRSSYLSHMSQLSGKCLAWRNSHASPGERCEDRVPYLAIRDCGRAYDGR